MDENENRKRSFINEQIVPRKNFKKILLIVFLTVILGGVFGVIMGITFSVSQDLLGNKFNQETAPETIIIARDDPEETQETTLKEAGENTASEEKTGDGKKASDSGSEALKDPGETTEGDGESQTAEGESPAADTGKHADTDSEDSTLKSVYEDTKASFVTVSVSDSKGVDWFSETVSSEQECFGIFVAESTEYLYVLMDGSLVTEDADIRVSVSGKWLEASLQGYDELTKMCVLRLSKSDLGTESYEVASIGNSFKVSLADQIYMIGSPYGKTISLSEGLVTYTEKDCDAVDGYNQLIYTDMQRLPGGSAVLLSAEGSVIGWVSDATCGAEGREVLAYGISPLKYILEDLCSGVNTAYLGVKCVTVYEENTGLEPGFYVEAVEADSPAADFGILAGDRLVAIDGKTVYNSHLLESRLELLKAGDIITVTLERRGVEGYEAFDLSIQLKGR